jgi:hypothetical protein
MGHPSLPDLGHAVDIPIKYTHNTWPWKELQDEAPSSLKLLLTMRASLSLSSPLTLDESSSLSLFPSHKIGS